MKRALIGVSILLVAGLSAATVTATEKEEARGDNAATQKQSSRLPEPAREGGDLEQGGTDIGRGSGHGGRELGQGTAGFGKNAVQGKFGQASRSMGHGAAEFGKGVGIGMARGFRSFGRAFRNLGKKIDGSVSDDEER